MKKSSVSHANVYVFWDSVWLSWKDERERPIKYFLGRQVDVVHEFITIQSFGTIDGEPMEFEWNISQDSPHCSSATKSKSSCQKWAKQPVKLTGCIIFMTMFNDISWWSEDNDQEFELGAKLVSVYARRFSPGRWSFLGPGSEKKWHSTHEKLTPRRMGQRRRDDDQIQWKRTHSLPIHESIVSRNAQEQRRWKIINTSSLMSDTIETFFEQLFLFISSVFTEQSQICVKNTKLAMLEHGDLFW